MRKSFRKVMAFALVALQLFSILPANQVNATEASVSGGDAVVLNNTEVATGSALSVETYDYSILDGENAEWTEGNLTFRVNADFNTFSGVAIDGTELSSSEYSAYEGSTIVEVNESYLSNLNSGNHTTTMSFTGGTTVDIPFTVANTQAQNTAEAVINIDAGSGVTKTITRTASDETSFAFNISDMLAQIRETYSLYYFEIVRVSLPNYDGEVIDMSPMGEISADQSYSDSIDGMNYSFTCNLEDGDCTLSLSYDNAPSSDEILEDMSVINIEFMVMPIYLIATPECATDGFNEQELSPIVFYKVGDTHTITLPEIEGYACYGGNVAYCTISYNYASDSVICDQFGYDWEFYPVKEATIECTSFPSYDDLSGTIMIPYTEYGIVATMNYTAINNEVSVCTCHEIDMVDYMAPTSCQLHHPGLVPVVVDYRTSSQTVDTGTYLKHDVLWFDVNMSNIVFVDVVSDFGSNKWLLGKVYTQNVSNPSNSGVQGAVFDVSYSDIGIGAGAENTLSDSLPLLEADCGCKVNYLETFTADFTPVLASDIPDTYIIQVTAVPVTETVEYYDMFDGDVDGATYRGTAERLCLVGSANRCNSADCTRVVTGTVPSEDNYDGYTRDADNDTTVSGDNTTKIYRNYVSSVASIEVAKYTLNFKAEYNDGTPAEGVVINGNTTDATGYTSEVIDFSVMASDFVFDSVSNRYFTDLSNITFTPSVDSATWRVDDAVVAYETKSFSYDYYWTCVDSQIYLDTNKQVTSEIVLTVDGLTRVSGSSLADGTSTSIVYDDTTKTYTILRKVGDAPSNTGYDVTVNITNYDADGNICTTSFTETISIAAGATTVPFNVNEMLEALEIELGGTVSFTRLTGTMPNKLPANMNPFYMYSIGTCSDDNGDTLSLNLDTTSGDASFGITYLNSVYLGYNPTTWEAYTEETAIARDLSEINLNVYWSVETAKGVKTTVKYVDFTTGVEIADSQVVEFSATGETSAVLDKEIEGYVAIAKTNGSYTSLACDKDTSNGSIYWDMNNAIDYYPCSNFVASCSRLPSSGVVEDTVKIRYYKLPAKYDVNIYQVFNNDFENKTLYSTLEVNEGGSYVRAASTLPVVNGYTYKGYTTIEIGDWSVSQLDATADISFTGIYANTDIYLHYVSPITLTIKEEYYKVDGTLQNTVPTTVSLNWGDYYNNTWSATPYMVLYDAYKAGHNKISVSDYFYADTELVIRYAPTTKYVDIVDAYHDADGLFINSTERTVSLGTRTSGTINASNTQGYSVLTAYGDCHITEPAGTTYYKDTNRSPFGTDILAESQTVDYLYEVLEVTLPTIDTSKLAFSSVGTNGAQVGYFPYVFLYQEIPAVEYTVTVQDRYLDEQGVEERIDTRLTEQKAEGSSYSYNALSPVPDGYSVIGDVTKSGTVTEDITIVFTYQKDVVTYTITVKDKYLDESGAEERTDVRLTESVVAGSSYSYSALNPVGYELKSEVTISGVANSDVEVVFVYQKIPTFTITVYDKYLNTDGTEEKTELRLTDEQLKGYEYSYNALSPVGYSVESEAVISGTLTDDVVITFVYKKLETYLKVTVIDRFLDYEGNLERTSTRLELDAVRKGTTYTCEALNPQGYTVVGDDSFSGVINEDTVITFIYQAEPPVYYTVVVKDKYLSIDGDEQKVDTRLTEELLKDSSYSYDALNPVPNGYVVTSDTNYSGTITEDIEIVFVYQEDAARFVTVKGYITYKDGTPIANKRIEIHSTPRYAVTDENGYYEVNNVEVGDHKFTIFASDDVTDTTPLVTCDLSVTKPDEDTVAVTFKAENCEVTTDTSVTDVLEIDAILPLYRITVIDEFYLDGALVKSETRTEVTVKAGDSYSYDALSNTGYSVSGTKNYSGVALSDLTLVFKYTKSTPVYVPDYYELKVLDKYYDEFGSLERTNIRVSETVMEYTSYEYDALNPTGYTVSGTTHYEGTVTADTILVFSYIKEKVEPEKYTLTVIDKFYGEDGNLESENIRLSETIEEGSGYYHEALVVDGYTVSGAKQYSGIVSGDTTLVFTYVKDKPVIIPEYVTITVIDNFYDSNSVLESSVIREVVTVEVGTDYDYDALNVQGYVVSGAYEYTGTATEDITLVFSYIKEVVKPTEYTITVIDRYHDEDGNVEHEDIRLVETVEEGTSYYYEALKPAGYIVSGSSSYSGVVTSDITLFFEYTKEKIEIVKEYTITVIDKYIVETVAPVVDASFGGFITEGLEVSVNQVEGKSIYTVSRVVRCIDTYAEGSAYEYFAQCPVLMEVIGATEYKGVVTEDLVLEFVYAKSDSDVTNIPEEVIEEEPEPIIPWAPEPKTGDGQLPVDTAKPYLPYVMIALPVALGIIFKRRKKQ